MERSGGEGGVRSRRDEQVREEEEGHTGEVRALGKTCGKHHWLTVAMRSHIQIAWCCWKMYGKRVTESQG